MPGHNSPAIVVPYICIISLFKTSSRNKQSDFIFTFIPFTDEPRLPVSITFNSPKSSITISFVSTLLYFIPRKEVFADTDILLNRYIFNILYNITFQIIIWIWLNSISCVNWWRQIFHRHQSNDCSHKK